MGNAQVPPSYPIVYCSDGFCELSGFPRAQIMQKGCACKFLHGAETDDDKKEMVEDALKEKKELKLEVKFYKKHGACVSLFSPRCHIFLFSHSARIGKAVAGK